MSAFEKALEECLEAIRTDGLSIEECLRRYPEHAEQLGAHLLAVATVAHTYASATPSEDFAAQSRARFLIASGQALNTAFEQADPAEEFAAAARERYLIASGERLGEAYGIEPSPSFFAAARARVLMAGHLMRRQRAERARPRGLSLMPGLRAAGALAAVLIAFSAFSTYTVATADNSLPGDWQYPIKLKTERVRLALAFGESAKRDVRLHLAKERANEIAELAQNGETIGPDELHRLVAQTQPLIDDVGSNWDPSDVAKLEEVSAVQQQALQLAAPQVEPSAQDDLAQAQDVAQAALAKSAEVRAKNPGPPLVITPSLKLTSTSEPDATRTPAPQATPTVGLVIPDGSTPGAGPTNAPSAKPTSTSTAVPPLSVGTPAEDAVGVTWIRVAVGQMSALMPSQKDGWYIQGVNVADENIPLPTLLHLSNIDATSLVTINTRNGDVYWLISHDGRFDEIQMRLDVDGEVRVVDRDVLRQAYGDLASIPLYILDSIVIAPPAPTATTPPALP